MSQCLGFSSASGQNVLHILRAFFPKNRLDKYVRNGLGIVPLFLRQENKPDPYIQPSLSVPLSQSIKVQGCRGEDNFAQNFKYFTLLKHCLETEKHRIFHLCFLLFFERLVMKLLPLCFCAPMSCCRLCFNGKLRKYMQNCPALFFQFRHQKSFCYTFLKKHLFEVCYGC